MSSQLDAPSEMSNAEIVGRSIRIARQELLKI
jgi:hypothetical protein